MTKFQTPRGTRDLPPAEMRKRQRIIATCQKVFERYGFEPLETPAFEDWKMLSAKQGGGDAIRDEIYYFRDKSKRELGLRFDLTVPASRFVASNPSLPKPFRRYQIGRVWRYDRPGAGRYREFWQADVDIFGSDSPLADAECVLAACDVLEALGISFVVRMNSRAIMEDFLKGAGIKNADGVLRAIDKLDKIGKEGVAAELKTARLKDKGIKELLNFISLSDGKKILSKLTDEGKSAYETLKRIGKIVSSRFETRIDMSLVRGLAYYTGPVFEIVAGAGPSIGGGGRYDSLVALFGGPRLSATGISLGVDRIAALMPDEKATSAKVFIASVSEKTAEKCARLAQELRSAGVSCEYDVTGRGLSKQLAYASSKGIPYVLVVGEKELASGKYKLRDMRSGKESLIEEKDFRKLADEI